jgi:ribonucleoside-diphosphate reductase beta chain
MRIYYSVSNAINKESLPYRLYEKAKKYGIWNPADIDFSQDKKDWETLTEDQRDEVTTLLAYFAGGEEAVTKDILPLIMTCANKGWIEEEMYLTTFLFEEAKHVDFFRTVMENLEIDRDLSSLVGEGHHMLFQATEETMGRLRNDPSPEAIVDACITYNMYAEGVSAESSYWYFEQALGSVNKMPGLLEGINNLKRDESRHIAFGLYMLQRQISEHPHLLDRALEKLQSYEPITAIISAEFIKKISFGVTPEAVTQFADRQLRARLSILEKAKYQTLEEIFNTKETEIVL